MMGSDKKSNKTNSFMQGASIPLVNMSHVNEWQQRNDIVKGTAPRWLFPVIAEENKVDSLVMVMNISL